MKLRSKLEGQNIWFNEGVERWVIADYPNTDDALYVGRYEKRIWTLAAAIEQFKIEFKNTNNHAKKNTTDI